QADCHIPMGLQFLILIPCTIKLQYDGQPEEILNSIDHLVLTDINTGKNFTPWEWLSASWYGQPDMEPGSWSRLYHFGPADNRPGGKIKFSVIVESRTYISRASLNFIGLVDQHSQTAHASTFETPPLSLNAIEDDWKRLPDASALPPGIFTLRLKA